MQYAILNGEGRCINRILWDGMSNWQPPKGCTAIPDPNNEYPVLNELQIESSFDPLTNLTLEQKTALLALLQSQ